MEGDPWIYKMTFTKYKVHRYTGEVVDQGGWTKTLNKTKNTGKKKKGKTKTKKKSIGLAKESKVEEW